MVDLDRPIKVVANGKVLFAGIAPRTIANLAKTLDGPGDPKLAFPAEVAVTVGR